MKKFLVLLTLTVLFSCKKEEKITADKTVSPTETKVEVQKDIAKSKGLTLETFGFPQEIQGCSCYFATDREQFIKQNYIYVDDYQQNGYVKINGRQIKLKYDKKNEVLPEKSLNINLHSDDYKVNLKGTVVEEGEIETALYKGTLTIETKDGKKIETPVYGECGC